MISQQKQVIAISFHISIVRTIQYCIQTDIIIIQ